MDIHLAQSVSIWWPLIFRSLRTVCLQVSVPFSQGFATKSHPGQWVVRNAEDMTKPVPASLDGLRYYRHPSSFEQLFVWDNIWPVDLEDTSKATSSFLSAVTDVFQHSNPYKEMLGTLLLKILILVWMLSSEDLQCYWPVLDCSCWWSCLGPESF